jgi:hypothetical protein
MDSKVEQTHAKVGYIESVRQTGKVLTDQFFWGVA